MNADEKKPAYRRRALFGWLLGGLLAAFFFLPICDLHFDCGCSWPGRGAYAHCDIHTAGPPDCPWCARPVTFLIAAAFSYGVGMAGAFAAARRLPLAVVVLVSLGGNLAALLVAGVVTSLALGRPPLAGL